MLWGSDMKCKKIGCVLLVAAWLGSAASLALASPRSAQPLLRLKDLGRVQGWRENALIGYGLVTGLAGTGDSSSNRATRQAMSNLLARFELGIAPEQMQSRNVAVVMVTAQLPTFARIGDTLDITVTSAGDARSLLGGSLLLTPLKGADDRVYALAQGPLQIGGYRYDANGNVVQKNHPTVGSVPNGASVEVGLADADSTRNPASLTFVLNEPDYSTAQRVADAINQQLAPGAARARDAAGIEVALNETDRARTVAFVSRLESVQVDPDRRARVVINERTGTVVSGGDVRIDKVVISQGDLKLSVATVNSVSQPTLIGGVNPGIETATLSNSTVEVNEGERTGFLESDAGTVADLVRALSRLKIPTRDLISILRAIKTAGALHAELVVQ